MAKAPSGPKRFWCTKCHSRFTRKDDAHRHYKEKHAISKLYQCPKKGCDTIGPNKDNCKRHIKLNHGGRGRPIEIVLSANDPRSGDGWGVPRDQRIGEDDEEDEDEEDEEDEENGNVESEQGAEGEGSEEGEEDEVGEVRAEGTPPPVAGLSGVAFSNLPVSAIQSLPNPVPQSVATPQALTVHRSRPSGSPYHRAYAAHRQGVIPRSNQDPPHAPAHPPAVVSAPNTQGNVFPSFQQGLFQAPPVYSQMAAPPAPQPQGQLFLNFNQGPLQMPAHMPGGFLAPTAQGTFPSFQHVGPLQAPAVPQPQGVLVFPGFNQGAAQPPAAAPTAPAPLPAVNYQQAAPAEQDLAARLTLPIPDLPLPPVPENAPFHDLTRGSWEIPDPRGPWNIPLGDAPQPTLEEMLDGIENPGNF